MSGKMDPEIKKLILWRIETGVPAHFKLSMGDKGTFNKQELKEHVEKEDSIGLKIVAIELRFIKSLATGEFSKALVESA